MERSSRRAPHPARQIYRFRYAQHAGLSGDLKVKIPALLLVGAACLHSQGLDPAELLKPSKSTWPSYNGDYTGRRYSSLSQINTGNIGAITMAWAFQTHQQAI